MRLAAVVLSAFAVALIVAVLVMPQRTRPTPQPVPTPVHSPSHSYRPGSTPWADCTAHPGPHCPSPPPTACPTKVDPGLVPFYPCLGGNP
jgi:hypothetical protein